MLDPKAFSKARRWLRALDIPPDDTERHLLRVFGLSVANASVRELRACGRALPSFTWFHYTGDPVPALIAHRSLLAAEYCAPDLAALEAGYRSLLSSDQAPLPLLCDLLCIPPPDCSTAQLPRISELLAASREEVLEACRIVTMLTSRGARPFDAGEAAAVIPALAVSYARDWDIETCGALLRAATYLKLSDSPECRWSAEWLLDQQQTDGRFGLLNSEAASCGWDESDWRLYFDRTIHAVWALSELDAAQRR